MQNPIALLDQYAAIDPQQRLHKLTMGPKEFVFIFDPKIAHEVLADRTVEFIHNKTIFDRIKPITGNRGLVQLSVPESKKMRPNFAAMFSGQNMIKMKKLVADNTQEFVTAMPKSGNIDITLAMTDLILRNAFQLFLGLDMREDALSIGADFQELNALCGQRMISPLALPLSIPTKRNRRIKHLQKSLRHKVALSLKKQKTTDSVNVPQLFADQDLDLIIDQCMTFLFAGHETTASSLSFTFLLLAQHPEYIKAIQDGDDALALRVYKEALRLFPPAYMLAREATQDCVLHEITISKGTQVIIGLKQIHQHPSFHDEPLSFKPERFKQTVEAFLPFGAGPKVCIGEGIAYMEASTIIKIFCRTFDFTTTTKNIASYPLVTLHPAAGQFLEVQKI